MKIRTLAVVTIFFVISCNGETMTESKSMFKDLNDIPVTTWIELSKKSIFFGHQSVGSDILKGLEDIEKEYPFVRLNIKETDNPEDILPGTFAHILIGQNRDPLSKIGEFKTKMNKGLGDRVDIAFLKFCFVDIDSKTDIKTLFEKYRDTMSELSRKYPETKFIHCTVPLLIKEPFSIKSKIRKLLSRGDRTFDLENNIARNRFNDMLRSEYRGNEQLFDLAGAESSYLDGSRETFSANGKQYYALLSNYSSDGGHLNELGRKVIAQKLILFFAKL